MATKKRPSRAPELPREMARMVERAGHDLLVHLLQAHGAGCAALVQVPTVCTAREGGLATFRLSVNLDVVVADTAAREETAHARAA